MLFHLWSRLKNLSCCATPVTAVAVHLLPKKPCSKFPQPPLPRDGLVPSERPGQTSALTISQKRLRVDKTFDPLAKLDYNVLGKAQAARSLGHTEGLFETELYFGGEVIMTYHEIHPNVMKSGKSWMQYSEHAAKPFHEFT